MIGQFNRREFIKSASVVAAAGVLPLTCGRQSVAKAGQLKSVPPLLIDCLKSNEPMVKPDAARLLGDLGSPAAVDPLVDYVCTDRYYSKTAGLDALMRIGDPSAAKRIHHLIDKPGVHNDHYWYGCSSVRLAAALAVLSLGDESVRDFLLADEKTLDDGRGVMRDWPLFTWFGPTVLKMSDDLATTRELKARFTMDKVSPSIKPDAGQMTIISDTLGLMGTAEAQERLQQLLSSYSRYVRARAAINLMDCSSRNSHIRKVASLATGDPKLFTRIKASQALVEKGYQEHFDRIINAAEFASRPFDRAVAVESLGLLGRPQDVGVIAAGLESDESYLRLCAVEALERIGTDYALDKIQPLVNDSDLRVRMQAVKALAVAGQAS